MADAFEVKENVGDVVTAKKDYGACDVVSISNGEEWTVAEKKELFVKVKRDNKEYWISSNIFNEVFVGE